MVLKGMPWGCGLMAFVVAVAVIQEEWRSALYFGAYLVGFIVLRWIAAERKRWDRVMGWLPDELRGKE